MSGSIMFNLGTALSPVKFTMTEKLLILSGCNMDQNRTKKIKDAAAQGARRGIFQSQLLEERGLSTILALHESMRSLREREDEPQIKAEQESTEHMYSRCTFLTQPKALPIHLERRIGVKPNGL